MDENLGYTKTVTIIIDFDNYFKQPLSKSNAQQLEYSFSELINYCEDRFKDVSKILIRLYGGWYQGMNLTKRASLLNQLMAEINLFPKIKGKKKIIGSVELASEIIGIPGYIWGHTYKTFDGVKPIRINKQCESQICDSNKETCPKYILRDFTSKKTAKCQVESCSNTHNQVFHGNEQKMVDTIITCDILSVIEQNDFRGLLVISDDQDLFPSIALANEKRKMFPNRRPDEIVLAIQNKEVFDFCSDFFHPIKIQPIHLV